MMARRTGGFTLMEMLIAIVLLSLVLLVLFSGLRTGVRSWAAAERVSDSNEASLQVRELVARLVRGAVPIVVEGLDDSEDAFDSGETQITLVAPGVAALGRPGLYLYRLFFESRSGGLGDVWATVIPFRPDQTEASGEPRLVLENVAQFSFRYFGVRGDAETPEWGTDWRARDGVPRLVAFTFLAGNGGVDREQFVAPMVTAEARK